MPLLTAKVILWQTVLVVEESSELPEERPAECNRPTPHLRLNCQRLRAYVILLDMLLNH